MYNDRDLESFSNAKNLMKLMKRYTDFNEHTLDVTFNKGESFFRKDAHRYCYLVKEGYFKVKTTNEHGDHFLLLVEAGHIIFFPLYYSVVFNDLVATALDEAQCLRIESEFLKKVIALEDPHNHVTLQYLTQVSRRFYSSLALITLSSKQRVVYTLIKLVDTFGRHTKAHEIELPSFVNYETIAEFSRCSRSYTISVLTTLRKQNIISSKKSGWIVLDENLLRKEEHGQKNEYR
ncbi:Crp/Fnr family transcriptional regulator [Listeria booriae]|uniref:Crp/Fnr family transcriptional regulator n=1 Tax=Listeria booriae TaxID=1552123 RepID=UPI0016286C34|nr:Crp/Fnr family transcriptional regulator [Listeria booriae]MBC2159540.1 Crp/Fnr family transcriptional regulator [Listeria booriae]MBC2172785.1 Crp/Fnr family transcriptional regulator [Listeria booriae]